MVPGVPLLSEPVVTRLGTWTEATVCYFDHFQVVKGTQNAKATEAEEWCLLCCYAVWLL
jgi:hypothetical protein